MIYSIWGALGVPSDFGFELTGAVRGLWQQVEGAENVNLFEGASQTCLWRHMAIYFSGVKGGRGRDKPGKIAIYVCLTYRLQRGRQQRRTCYFSVLHFKVD